MKIHLQNPAKLLNRLLLATLALLSSLTCGPSILLAQGTVFTYQGRVTDNGANFTGTGQFKFALVTGTNGQTATASAVMGGVSPNEFVSSCTVNNAGSGYVTPPAVTFSGGGGSGVTAMANINGGSVSSITVDTPGSGYSSPPTVTIAPPPPGYLTWWSNDGTSVNGSQPSTAVSVAVNNGLFTLVLGDVTQTNMTAIPATLFAAHTNLQLRIWFNDGLNGFAVLSPPQNLTPAPYAVFANSSSNLLGTLPATQLSGTLPLSAIAAAVITNNETSVILNGAFTGNGSALTNLQLSAIGPAGTFTLQYIYSPATYAVGNGPHFVVAADVNGDSRVDLICANPVASTLTVLTNNGSGVFGSNATLSVGAEPQCVVAADVNGDGKLDLISANLSASTLTVLTNNGSGVFGFNATLNVGPEPNCVVAADVNDDGNVDLICANFGTNTLTVLTNNGSGVFGFNATLTAGSGPASVAAADVNGDGKVDLICANGRANTLTVLTNNGSGVFGSNATLNVGSEPISVVAADVNGDGKVDLICADYFANTLTVLTNNGSGVFGFNATFNVGSGSASVAAADVNGDGKVDLISANYNDSTLSVLTSVPQIISGTAFSFGGNLNSFNGTFNGIFNGNGDGLTNVALLNSNQTFTGQNYFTPNVGIGTTSPSRALEVDQATDVEIGIRSTNAGGHLWTLQSTSPNGAGELASSFQIIDRTLGVSRLLIGTNGNVGIDNSAPTQLFVVGTGGAYCNGTSWVNGSDRNSKADFVAIDPREVLEKLSALPISEWRYKVEAPGTEHLGPVAQDFYAAFGLGGDERAINTVDEGGVALAAIQGLNEKLQQKDAEIAELKLRLEKLEQQITSTKGDTK